MYDGHARGLGPSDRWSWVAARSADRARYGHCAEVVFTSHEGDGHQLSLSISKGTAMPLLETPRMVLDALIAALIFGVHSYVDGVPSHEVPILDWVSDWTSSESPGSPDPRRLIKRR